MKTLKINSEKDLYVAAFKLLNILGPVAGVLIIIGTVALGYVQTHPRIYQLRTFSRKAIAHLSSQSPLHQSN
ncbi:MAG: hypothetical protein RM022_021230 [Nostoc sp. EfeVER01]|uniref:hypothetical protein n=1 Tax=Nostoc sp. EfeVER01 TaxID=3075406 RepID=UPI002AD3D670|nr:hypothetical protein [Nostoc sp. EfeVER01]MDZ7946599.1 hypothetical protein [Nostoc sp. EfeVER01]